MKTVLIRLIGIITILSYPGNVVFARQNLNQFHNKKHVVLDKNYSFERQVTQANTVYVVKDGFTLSKNIVIPKESVLLFDGGFITGTARVTFQDTEIKGTFHAISSTLDFDGTLKGNVNLFYFDVKTDDQSYDNGRIINKVTSVFKHIYIPSGDIFFITPIVMSSMNLIECDANLFYCGKATNISAITVTHSDGIFNFNGIIRNESHSDRYPVYTSKNNSRLIGLEISSVNNSQISFKTIVYFNEGLRISDTSHLGCCYNTFMLGTIINANYHIRVYQHNKNNSPSNSTLSWCNQNLFLGGRCTNYTHDWNYNESTPCYCFYFNGGKQEGFNDSQNSINNITIIGTSLEIPNDANIYIQNGSNFNIINTRHENSKIALKLVGRSSNIHFRPGYGNNKVDLSENGHQGLSMTSGLYYYELSDNYTEIDVSRHKYIKIDSPVKGRFYIKYLEDMQGRITDLSRNTFPVIMDTYYHPSEKALITSGDVYSRNFIVPDNIVKIGIRASNAKMKGGVIILGD